MQVRSAGLLALALFGLAACGSTKQSSSSTPGAATRAGTTPQTAPDTGCRSQLTIGDRITLRVQLTARRPAKYTVVRLEGARDLMVNAITDETGAHGRLNRIKADYVLPGPRAAGAKKTIAATMTAKKVVGETGITLTAWASDQANSEPPANAPSSDCPVTVLAR